jgi:hypothetical protein
LDQLASSSTCAASPDSRYSTPDSERFSSPLTPSTPTGAERLSSPFTPTPAAQIHSPTVTELSEDARRIITYTKRDKKRVKEQREKEELVLKRLANEAKRKLAVDTIRLAAARRVQEIALQEEKRSLRRILRNDRPAGPEEGVFSVRQLGRKGISVHRWKDA